MQSLPALVAARLVLAWLLIFSGAFAGLAQETKPINYADVFDKKEVMIRARDGVKLHTEIYTPKGPGPFPIIFERTPYGISAPDKGYSYSLNRYADMIPEGYIFVFQDIRGRYGSEGQFVMNRPIHDPSDTKGVDESTDAFDTIDPSTGW
jgi:predicted acyl esterase